MEVGTWYRKPSGHYVTPTVNSQGVKDGVRQVTDIDDGSEEDTSVPKGRYNIHPTNWYREQARMRARQKEADKILGVTPGPKEPNGKQRVGRELRFLAADIRSPGSIISRTAALSLAKKVKTGEIKMANPYDMYSPDLPDDYDSEFKLQDSFTSIDFINLLIEGKSLEAEQMFRQMIDSEVDSHMEELVQNMIESMSVKK